MTDVQAKPAVSYSESLEITGKRVGEFLQGLLAMAVPELILASCAGDPPDGPQETESYAFVVKPKVPRFVFREKPRVLIANLWFKNEVRHATHKKWVLEIFGREHIEFFKDLAHKLVEGFKVEIHVRLKSEKPQYTSMFGK